MPDVSPTTKKYRPGLACLLCGFIAFGSLSAQTFSNREIIIKFRADVSADTVPQTAALSKTLASFPGMPADISAHLVPLFSSTGSSLAKAAAGFTGRYFKLQLSSSRDILALVSHLMTNADIEYAEPNYVWQVAQSNLDPLLSSQHSLEQVAVPDAWKKTTGSPAILLAIIDTGVDYLHEDLVNSMWINPGEDLNGNGVVDAGDFNNLDDDNNGYVDDIRGWDFTDAPSFPDDGDFETRDNDPMDELGHGTSVSGIVAAERNNGLGIAGIAPDCRIMALRAGTKSGFLEEDDVAAAVIYAVENGAHVINMSFGDVFFSQLLEDVVVYAEQQGVLVIASSGNGGTDTPHYPSGFPETLSVGAVDEDDSLAGFSNFGITLDLVAPGTRILTCALNDEYRQFSGTSAATPIVTGIAGLILSLEPQLSPLAVRARLQQTAKDLGATGVDHRYGAGLVMASAAVGGQAPLIAQLAPQPAGSASAGMHSILGTAAGSTFRAYDLYYATDNDAPVWQIIQTGVTNRVIDGVLAQWEPPVTQPSGIVLRLVVHGSDGLPVEDRITWFTTTEPFRITNRQHFTVLDGQQEGLLVRFETSSPARGRLLYRPAGTTRFFEREAPFIANEHQFVLRGSEITGPIEYFIVAEDAFGTVVADSTLLTYIPAHLPVIALNLTEHANMLPAGHVFPLPLDMNHNGFPELLMNVFAQPFAFGEIGIFELQGTAFIPLATGITEGIPRDAGDFDGDGLSEILLGLGDRTFIYEASDVNGLPDHQTWESDGELWGARIVDVDHDHIKELIGRIGSTYRIFERTGDNTYVETQVLLNPSEGQNGGSIPHVEIGDFDGDGRTEIVYADADGDILIHEWQPETGQFTARVLTRLGLTNAIDFLASGDFDGDGRPELIAGSHSSTASSSAIDPETRFWEFVVFDGIGDNQLVAVDTFRVLGVHPPGTFDSGIGVGDIDGDGDPEIIISTYPDLYVLDYHAQSQRYRPVWYHNSSRSSRFLVMRPDSLSAPILVFQGATQMQTYTTERAPTRLPQVSAFTARLLDAQTAELTWQYNHPQVDAFTIVRYSGGERMTFPVSGLTRKFVDTSLQSGLRYQYTIEALPATVSLEASVPVSTATIRPGIATRLLTATMPSESTLRLLFSAPLDIRIMRMEQFRLTPTAVISSIVPATGASSVILTFSSPLPAGDYTITVDATLLSREGMPVAHDARQVAFTAVPHNTPPYILSIATPQRGQIDIIFDQAMEPLSVRLVENYTLPLPLIVDAIQWDPGRPEQVTLLLSQATLVNGEFELSVSDVYSKSGSKIREGRGDAATFLVITLDTQAIVAFPNPVRLDTPQASLTFANLPGGSKLFITTISGKVVKEWPETQQTVESINWDLRTEGGKVIPSGIYIYIVKQSQKTVRGKIAVIR